MPRVIPSGTTDYTTQIAMREAAANDALTRLFYSMIMRREDRERSEALRRELQQNQQQFTTERDAQFRRDRLEDYDILQRNNPQTAPSKLRSPGTGQSTPPAAVAPAPAPAAPAARPDGTQFQSPSGTVGPNPNKFSELMNSDYDTTDGGTVELSAQSRKNPSVLPRPQAPRQSRATSKKGQSVFAGDTPPDIAQAWRASEDKYGLAHGTLQALMGLYNNGGTDDGSTPEAGSDRLGWFKFSKELRMLHNLSDADTANPITMGEAAARNLKRNLDATNKLIAQYNKANGTQFPKLTANSSRNVPALALLSQLGVHDGPAVILQQLVYPNAPLADALSKGPDGKPRDGGRVLINIGHDADTTANEIFKQTHKDISPYYNETVRSQDSGAPVGRTQQGSENAPPRPPADVGGGRDIEDYLISRGVKADRIDKIAPEMRGRIAYVMQKAEEATGSRISVSSSYRDPHEQAQVRANSRGVPVTYNGVRYLPQPGPRGFMAAPPGRSRHQQGTALDFNRSPARDWLHSREGGQLLRSVGLETLRGDAPHVQLSRGTLPAFTYPTTQTAAVDTPAPAAATPAPAVAPKVAAAPVIKPTVADKGAVFGKSNLPTFGVAATAPLATMPNAVAGMRVGQEQPVVAQPTTPPATAPAPTTTAPSASTAAANQPTPQTAPATTTQAPTAAPVTAGPADSLMTTPDDIPSQMTDPLSGLELPTAPSLPGLSVDIFRAGPEAEVGASDEGGMIETPPWTVDEAVPGKNTDFVREGLRKGFDAITGAPANIMQGIREKAEEYNRLAASRNESRQLEQMYDYSRQPDNGITLPSVNYDPGYLSPDRMYEEQDAALERRAAEPPPNVDDAGTTQYELPTPRSAEQYGQPSQARRGEGERYMPPPVDFTMPSYQPFTPQDQQELTWDALRRGQEAPATTPPPTPPTQHSEGAPQPPAAVVGSPEAANSEITDAIYGRMTEDQGGSGSGGIDLSWIAKLLRGGSSSNAKAANQPRSVKTIAITPPPAVDPLAIPKRELPTITPKPASKSGSSSIPPELLKPGGGAAPAVPSRKDFAPKKRRDESGKVVIDEPKKEDDEEQ